jgi:nitrogen fixation/metabolism regulation signal transduction histidine kinase
MDRLREKRKTGKELSEDEEQMMEDYETVVIKLDTMRPLLEAFEYAEMPSADTEKEG